MADENLIMIKRESKRRPQFWLKAIGTLGIWTISWKNNYLGLTERSIIRRKGVFTKQERAVPLNQVQDISISYGIIRRMLGHGDIRIETAGGDGTEVVMNNIDDPEGFRTKVFSLIDEFYSDGNNQRPTKDKKEE